MNDGSSTDRGNPSREVVLEAIDRNRHNGRQEYAETFDFAIRGDGVVQVTAPDDRGEQLVTVKGGTAVACTCYGHREAVGRADCRHMRAVEAHPRL